MDQMHKRFTTEQVKALLKGYYQGMLDRTAIEEILGISKTRFFALLRQYRRDGDRFSLAYQAVQKAGGICPSIGLDAQTSGVIRKTAKAEVQRIIASGIGADILYGDIIALAYHTALLQLFGDDLEKGLVNRSIDSVCRLQAAAGGWPLGRSLLYAPGGHGVRVPSFHIGSTLAQMTLELEDGTPTETMGERGQAFEILFHHLVNTFQRTTVTNEVFEGWVRRSHIRL